MDKIETSLENLIGGLSENNYIKNYEWSIRDINNVETADRKLLINKKISFWVHDLALSSNSDFFAELFDDKTVVFNANESEIEHKNKDKNYLQFKCTSTDRKKLAQEQTIDYSSSDDEIKESYISIPHENLFFDILLWIYTKDHRKLKKVAKTFNLFINLISLGLKLKMKHEYFDVLLNKIEFEWKLEYFNTPDWSKETFTFPILERIIDDMKARNLTKIVGIIPYTLNRIFEFIFILIFYFDFSVYNLALLSWLKIDETQISDMNPTSNIDDIINYVSPITSPNQIPDKKKSINPSLLNLKKNYQTIKNSSSGITSTRTILEIDPSIQKEKGTYLHNLESKDLFFVRNYIIRTKLMSGISSKELKMLKKQYNRLHYAFDSNTILDEYVFSSNKNLFCLVCKKSFLSPFDVLQNLECKGEYFHPRPILNAKNEKFVCNHEGCKKRTLKGEFPCCHKNAQTAGCLLGDGKHHLILIEHNSCSLNTNF